LLGGLVLPSRSPNFSLCPLQGPHPPCGPRPCLVVSPPRTGQSEPPRPPPPPPKSPPSVCPTPSTEKLPLQPKPIVIHGSGAPRAPNAGRGGRKQNRQGEFLTIGPGNKLSFTAPDVFRFFEIWAPVVPQSAGNRPPRSAPFFFCGRPKALLAQRETTRRWLKSSPEASPPCRPPCPSAPKLWGPARPPRATLGSEIVRSRRHRAPLLEHQKTNNEAPPPLLETTPIGTNRSQGPPPQNAQRKSVQPLNNFFWAVFTFLHPDTKRNWPPPPLGYFGATKKTD